ncbi:lipid-transfer protein [Amycolatopsis acidicola]|uniref:Lipid-transfer protein n=1 Tax=Amycolatopsis acidicola TaxID=2596893 RepID=A0A5N0UW53_9PSEU|nr:lipid-transfer protein [Amycolatopsis acidicola]KAA9156340.1 lipid-transfer protein [Amycolatopsis acidicola]
MIDYTRHRDRCAIAGIGETEYTKRSGVSDLALAVTACTRALEDAGIDATEVDGIVRNDFDLVTHNELADALGVPDLTYWGISGAGGSAAPAQVAQAVAAIESGQASTVLVFRALNGRSGADRYGQTRRATDGPPEVGGGSTYDEYFLPYGLVAAGQAYSMVARRHMIEYGTTSEHLAHISLTCRERANANPRAQMHGRAMTMADYENARMISDPLRLFDYCLETDGACALVVTSAERARDGRRPPALIRAVSMGTGPEPKGGVLFPVLLRDSYTTFPSAAVARTLYERAGFGPDEVGVAQIYDCFTITALIQLEDYGFCEKGEGGPFAASGALGLDGRLPVNTGGGHLSEGYIHGLNHVVEGVRQIRGESTSQAPHSEICLVTGGSPPASSALILRRDA